MNEVEQWTLIILSIVIWVYGVICYVRLIRRPNLSKWQHFWALLGVLLGLVLFPFSFIPIIMENSYPDHTVPPTSSKSRSIR